MMILANQQGQNRNLIQSEIVLSIIATNQGLFCYQPQKRKRNIFEED